ncbi:ATP-dependent 6-phosphofructokinase [Clostridia bacterium]|nr:ATP-dependent 6-phosphofructokinase [Clostridia bacterium]
MYKKRIGILTSGGDAPGMNAVIRGVVGSIIDENTEIFGIQHGYKGLINGEVFEIKRSDVAGIINLGGTILYTARSEEFKTREGLQKAVDVCRKLKLDSVVVIGGDGSFRGALELSEYGIGCVGIPGTIDNDVTCTEYTIGFDTAVNTATEMIDKIRDTASANERCSIVEVMGRNSGNIALNTGIAVGATAILIPEVKQDFAKEASDRIKLMQGFGKKHFIVVITEGLIEINKFAYEIKKNTGIECRTTILGHVQRGGSPTVRDRVVASEMACLASLNLKENIKNRIIVLKQNKITDIDINEIQTFKKDFDFALYKKFLQILE